MPRNEGINFNREKLPKVVHYQASTFNSFCLPGTYILRQKVTKSTAGHLFSHTLPTQHLFCDRKLLISTAGHLFLHTLPTRHLLCDRKLLKSTAGHLFLHTLATRHYPGIALSNQFIIVRVAGHQRLVVLKRYR